MKFIERLMSRILRRNHNLTERYPEGKWCSDRDCLCEDVVEMTDGENECVGECEICSKCSEVKNN